MVGEVDFFVGFLTDEVGVIIVKGSHAMFEFVGVVAGGINGGLFLELDDIFVIHFLAVIQCYFLFIQYRNYYRAFYFKSRPIKILTDLNTVSTNSYFIIFLSYFNQISILFYPSNHLNSTILKIKIFRYHAPFSLVGWE